MSNAPRTRARLPVRADEEAVLLCSRAVRDRADDQRLYELLSDGRLPWPRLWAKAIEQEVEPLVARTLGSEPFASTLPEAVEWTKGVRRWTLTYNLHLETELGRIAAALHAHGIPVAPLKGTQLARRLFDVLDARRTRDIDILVQPAHLQQAREVLRSLGYRPYEDATAHHQAHTFHGLPWVRDTPTARLIVELHWGLSDARFVSVDYDALWQRILERGRDGQPWYSLPTEETLLFLALHLPKHQLGALRLLADIDRLVRREEASIDWSYTLALAQHWDVCGLLYFALTRAHVLLETPVPPWVVDRLAPAAWRRAVVGLLAGSRSIVRPPARATARYNRFQLAYCAMLTPFERCLAAYVRYLFSASGPRRPGTFGGLLDLAQRLGRGVGWTALVVAEAIAEQIADWCAGHLRTLRRSAKLAILGPALSRASVQ